MKPASIDSFKSLNHLQVGEQRYSIFDLNKAMANGLPAIDALPYTLKILLENQLRHEDGQTVQKSDILALAEWLKDKHSSHEISFYPSRVLMQDFTGVPAIVDLAAMRDALAKIGEDPKKINPLSPVDLIIDHSVQVDSYGDDSAFQKNVGFEFHRNKERYQFLRWGQTAFNHFRVVPPGTGICHQVNLEYLATVVTPKTMAQDTYAFPDTLVGTDSHTTMINGLAVLGWGVGGIEAEAVMLGQPYSMLIPEVVGFKLTGRLREGITATDLVLTVTEMLRKHGVVGKFVEFFGEGMTYLSLPDRATIANMAPEYGATCGFFPIDDETLNYLKLSGRPQELIALVGSYAKAQGLWHEPSKEKLYSSQLHLDLTTVEASLAGPKRPQDRVTLTDLPAVFAKTLSSASRPASATSTSEVTNTQAKLQHGDVVIAAITSCTNTSNPSVMLAAGLVAKKAVERGITVKPWVKTSLAPGSKVVSEYLVKSGLQPYLDQLGFNLVGYGCTTCIGNSGPLLDPIEQAIKDNHLLVSSVLSGNRNFEGRIHPSVEANWLASPPLVVAFALAGNTRINLFQEPLALDKQGQPVYLKDVWPTQAEIAALQKLVTGEMFQREYADVFHGDALWQGMNTPEQETYVWENDSTYIQNPPYFTDFTRQPQPVQEIKGARILAMLGDSVTTDHISPAGSIKPSSPAGKFLTEKGVGIIDYNSYGARRGNHEVMMRGTFANVRIRNEMVPGVEGGFTKNLLSGETQPIYDAAMTYIAQSIPTIIVGGKEYGTGSSRDWAAKGTRLLGVKAVLAESFERIHRGNLIGMGVLPLQFPAGKTRQTLGLTGDEEVTIRGIGQQIRPGQTFDVVFRKPDGSEQVLAALCRIDTLREVDYYLHGGIMPYVLRQLI